MTRLREIKSELKAIPQKTKKVQECLHPLIFKLKVNQTKITACLNDGRQISIPFEWFTKWGVKNPEQLKKYELVKEGDYMVYFPEVDVDLGVEVFTDGLRSNCPNCH